MSEDDEDHDGYQNDEEHDDDSDDGGGVASGWFEHRRWWVESWGSDAESVQLASAHESNHRQLAYSTTFGNLTVVLDEVASIRNDAAMRSTVSALVDCSRTTHEVFATWCSVTALGHSVDVLGSHGAYLRYWAGAERLVEAIESPYLRFHAVHAIARVCMQAPVAEAAVDVGLDVFVLSDLRERLRPDTRFARLSRDGVDWQAAISHLRAAADSDPTLAGLIGEPRLRAELFERTRQDLWQFVNATLFDQVAGVLAAIGWPTLPHDAQLGEAPGLLAAASGLTDGQPLSLSAGATVPAEQAATAVLTDFDAEGFSNGPRLRARWLSEETSLDELVAGFGDDAHIFLNVRAGERQVDSYTLEAPTTGPAVIARRTVLDDDGAPTVELCDLTSRDPAALGLNGKRVVGLVSARMHGNAGVAGWEPWMAPGRAALLLDVSLAANLGVWLATPGLRFHHCLLLSASFGRELPLLVAQLRHPDIAESHLMVRPLSHAGVRHHKAAFDEIDPAGERLVVDPSILQDVTVLPLVLAHLAGEETHFPSLG